MERIFEKRAKYIKSENMKLPIQITDVQVFRLVLISVFFLLSFFFVFSMWHQQLSKGKLRGCGARKNEPVNGISQAIVEDKESSKTPFY